MEKKMETQLMERPSPLPFNQTDNTGPAPREQRAAPVLFPKSRPIDLRDVRNLLLNEIRHLAIETIPRARLVKLTPETMTIGQDTVFSTHLAKLPDGTIEVKHPNFISLLARPGHNDHFSLAWRARFQTCDKVVRNIFDQQTTAKEREAIDQNKLNKELKNAAIRVLANTGYSYINNPSRIGHQILHAFLGRENVSRTLRIAGSKATLSDYNLIATRPELFEAAHLMNPNATVLWFIMTPHSFKPHDLTPQAILEQAHRYSEQLTQSRTPGRWDYFGQLNQRAVNHFLPGRESNMLLVAHHAEKAKTIPSYSATKTLAGRRDLEFQSPGFTQAFIRESELRTRKRGGGTQAQLVKQFKELTPVITAAFNQQTGELRTWEEWTQGSQPNGYSKPETQPKDPKTQRKPRATKTPSQSWSDRQNRMALDKSINQFLQEHLGPELTQLARQAVTVLVAPDTGVTITTRDESSPTFRLEKLPSGAILLESPKHSTTSMILPNPNPHQEDNDEEDEDAKVKTWTTRGLIFETIQRLGIQLVTTRWQQEASPTTSKPLKDSLIAASLSRFWSTMPDELKPWNQDRAASKAIQAQITVMVTPGIWETINSRKKPVTVDRYNVAAADPRAIRELERTNPGVMEWAYAHGSPTQEIRHPGQIVTMVKQNFKDNGIDAANWKALSKLPANTMREITKHNNLAPQAILLNQMAKTASDPDPLVIEVLLRTIDLSTDRQEWKAETARNNRNRAIELVCQESSKHPGDLDAQQQIIRKLQHILDYVRSMSTEDIPVLSKSYGGLLKKSDLWHRQITNERTHRKWAHLMDQQNNQYRSWSSTISEPTEDQGYTIVPLTSEKALYQESLDMEHCVIDYGSQCARNQSRIFSIHKDGKKLATSEICLTMDQGWKENQTRGPHNHPVDDQVVDVMKRTARRYALEYSKSPDRHQETWYEDNPA